MFRGLLYTRNAFAIAAFALSMAALPAPAQAAEESPKLLSAYELYKLPKDKAAAYVKAVRALIDEIEKEQSDRGMRYGTAQNLHPYLRWLIEEANAQTEWISGGKCVYAGRISTYAASKTPSCINSWRCKGNPRLIECNPALFGDEVCVASGDGATARCMREMKLSDKDLVAQMYKDEAKMNRWDAFKDEFDAFCNKQNILNLPKDQNYKSCLKIKTRIDAITKELGLQKPAIKEEFAATPPKQEPAATQPIKPTTQDACTNKGENFCGMDCPQPDSQAARRPVELRDIENTKYAELLNTMQANCNVVNDSDKDVVRPMDAAATLDQMGYCTRDAYARYRLSIRDPEQDEIVSRLVKGDPSVNETTSGGLWFKPPYSHAFASYFGLEQKEARQLFCSRKSSQEKLQYVMSLSDIPELGYGMNPSKAEIDKFLKIPRQVEKLPEWAKGHWYDGVSDRDKLRELNRFMNQVFFRRQLVSCLKRTLNNPERGQIAYTSDVPKKCLADTYSISEGTPQQLGEQIDFLLKNYPNAYPQRSVCLTAGGFTWRCHSCGNNPAGQFVCNCFEVSQGVPHPASLIPAQLTALRCGGAGAPSPATGTPAGSGRSIQSIKK